ncbi:hypothetical protein [Listeria ivanovii]|nr:hypothetical protein [Listeria ivanovii]
MNWLKTKIHFSFFLWKEGKKWKSERQQLDVICQINKNGGNYEEQSN